MMSRSSSSLKVKGLKGQGECFTNTFVISLLQERHEEDTHDMAETDENRDKEKTADIDKQPEVVCFILNTCRLFTVSLLKKIKKKAQK